MKSKKTSDFTGGSILPINYDPNHPIELYQSTSTDVIQLKQENYQVDLLI